jgi:fluoride ion exporter CrcB/FEX
MQPDHGSLWRYHETLQLVNGGDVVPVLFNTLGQLLAGLLAVYLGVIFARSLGGI